MARAHPGSATAAARARSWRRGRRNQSSTMASSVTGPASQASGVTICSSMLESLFASDLQHGQEGFLRYFHRADLFHALLAGLLFLEEFALARDVAAVTLGEHVLAQRLDRGARDDVR